MSCLRALSILLALLAVGCGEVQDPGTPDASQGDDDDDGGAEPSCSDGVQNGDEEGVDCGGSCAACVECSENSECESDLCVGGTCRTTRTEPCTDAAPDNATSIEEDVVTTYTPGSGWSEPAACEWQCNADYFQEDSSCINTRIVPCADNPPPNGTSIDGNVEITYTDAGGWSEPANCDFTCVTDYCKQGTQCVYAYTQEQSFEGNGSLGSKWFGGDDRDGFPAKNDGGGQSMRMTTTFPMARFAFYHTGPFDGASSGIAEDVNVRLEIRNPNGGILASTTTFVPASFSGGWVWHELEYTLSANTTYIFTSWVVSGYTQGVNSGIRGDTDAPFPSGSGYSARGSGGGLSSWAEWTPHAWDFWWAMRNAPLCAQP